MTEEKRMLTLLHDGAEVREFFQLWHPQRFGIEVWYRLFQLLFEFSVYVWVGDNIETRQC